MKASISLPVVTEEHEVAEMLLESDSQSDQSFRCRMPHKVPITLALLLALSVAALTLGHPSKGLVANLSSKAGLAADQTAPNVMTQTHDVIFSVEFRGSAGASAPVPYSAGDKASYVAAGTCQAGVALEGASDSGVIMVPTDAGIYELCYQSTGKSPAVQTGQVLKVLADYSPSMTGVTPSMADSAWGIDYSALMSGKSKEVIHGLDKIIRYGATDPYTDATVTWLKNYHSQLAAGLPASATQLQRIDESASLMFVGLAAK